MLIVKKLNNNKKHNIYYEILKDIYSVSNFNPNKNESVKNKKKIKCYWDKLFMHFVFLLFF